MERIAIYRDEDPQPLIARVLWVRRAHERLRGLIGRRPLAPGEGLLLTPCAAVHTCLMRYPLDLVFLDRRGVIVRCLEEVRPYRFAWAPRAWHALELSAGSVRALRLAVGERLRWGRIPGRSRMNSTVKNLALGCLPAAALLAACATTRPDALALLARADAAYAAGRLQEAEGAYREVARLVPTDAYAYFRLGNTLARQTRLDEAAKAYQEALIRDPQLPKVYHNLALVRLWQAQFALEEAIAKYPAHDPHRAQAIKMHHEIMQVTHGPVKEISSPAASPKVSSSPAGNGRDGRRPNQNRER